MFQLVRISCFTRLKGFYIDRDVTFADLMATLEEFYSKLFGQSLKMRYRPSFFPFVEPGMEVDMHCLACEGKGCSLCKHTGWLEVAGAGMVHPEVLKNGDLILKSILDMPGDVESSVWPC